MKTELVQCLNCRIGTLQRKRATYAQWAGDQLVLVPNVAAWQCDVCGEFAYDDETLVRVELLLGSQIERPRQLHTRQSRAGGSNRSPADDTNQRSVK